MTIGNAEGGIVRDEALLSKGGNTSAVPRSATAQCGAAPAISGHHVSTTNTVTAILAVGKFRAWLATSLLSAHAVAANAIARSTDSQQQCSLARNLPADTSAGAAVAWQAISANANTANAAACSVNSWQWLSLANANVANAAASSCGLANLNAANNSALVAANSANPCSLAKLIVAIPAASFSHYWR